MSVSSRRAVLATALVAVTAATTSLLVAVAPGAAAYPADAVQFDGHGWGHGRGLGQYGTLGYAVDESRSYSWMLDHYYGGTTKGTIADATVGVKLTEFDGTTAAPKAMLVTSGSAFAVGSLQYGAGRAARVRWTGSGWAIEEGPSCAGPWTLRQNVGSTARPEAKTAYTGNDINLMLSTCGQNRRSYRGSIMIMIADTTFTRVVNYVRMEQYLRGVVPRESPASWGDVGGGKGMEALKAQAVAARSYAAAERRHPLFQTCDTISCQVYGGAGLNGVRIEDSRSDAAVVATAGEVRIKNGGPARTEFSSSTGGHTAGGTFPAVPDDGDDVSSNPNRQWSKSVPVATVEAAYNVGTLQSVVVTQRNGLGRNGGRALQVKITGTTSSVTVTGDQLRSKLGLKSDWFYVINPTLDAPAVGVAGSGTGYVYTSTIGEALSAAGATTHGSMEGRPLPKGMIGVATTPSGKGYWLAGSDGSIYAFGDAPEKGSLRGIPLARPIVGITATKTGQGYWLVASDGGIFAFGDATFRGSMGGTRLNQPVVGMATDPDGTGYWLVARDGGIFSFDAKFYGSTGAIRLNQPIVGMTAHPSGVGYWFVAADGGVFTFPAGRPFLGSAGGRTLPAPVVGMAVTRTGNGYWLLGRDGASYKFGDAT